MMKKREWITYEVWKTDTCEALWNGEPWKGTYEIGSVRSGKTKVYEGVFTSVISDDGRKWIGRDRWCPTAALMEMFRAMNADGLQMSCAGLDSRFYTTGLTDGSGFGYLHGLEDEGAFHIFDPVENIAPPEQK